MIHAPYHTFPVLDLLLTVFPQRFVIFDTPQNIIDEKTYC